MIDQVEIVSTLGRLNGIYFNIANLDEYARKLATLGRSIEIRHDSTNTLLSYVLYYDNGPEVFISMVWTHPAHQALGYAKKLLKRLIYSSNKDIKLNVHKDNPARRLYESIGFSIEKQSVDVWSMRLQKRMAIMQPYVFPYLGYFHLIDASSLFVFYDDVRYKKRGWINRNRILLNGKELLFTVPLSKASQNRLIKDTIIAVDDSWRDRFKKTLGQAYQKSPYFSKVMPLVMSVLSESYPSVSALAIKSIVTVCSYLELDFNYTTSSVCSPETRGLGRADRLIEITKGQGYKRYANAPGGMALYSKEYFFSKGIELGFLKSDFIQYKQFSNDFYPFLSIIDVMMFNDPATIRQFCAAHKVV